MRLESAGLVAVRGGLALLLGLWGGAEAHAGSVRPILFLGDQDVSSQLDARILFAPMAGTDGLSVECTPAARCDVRPGRFMVLVRSPSHVALERPELVSDTPPGGEPKAIGLHVFPSAVLSLEPGRITEESVLTALDLESGLPFKKPIGMAGGELQVPARRVIPALFRGGEIASLWRPIALSPAQTLVLPPDPPIPRGQGRLVVSLLFPSSGLSGGNRAISVRWRTESGASPPDVAGTGDPWRWTGFWFGLPSGEGTLEIESREWTLAERVKLVVPDRATGFARELRVIPRPKLNARFETNDRLPGGEAEVELLDCQRLAGQTGPPHYSLCTLVSSQKRPVAGEFVFAGLQPVLHALRWRAGSFRGYHMVSLTDGRSRDVTMPVAIHRIRGTITRTSTTVPDATITWHHLATDFETSVHSDGEGRYQLLVSPAGDYAAFVDGAGFRRYAEVIRVVEDLEADFVVPSNTTEVVVRDADSGLPIPGAAVVWGLEAQGAANLGRSERVECDADGRARLPPFPPGSIRVTAKARGYRVSEERRLEITKNSSTSELELRLTRSLETRVRFVGMDGRPARGAWAQLPSGAATAPADELGETVFEGLVRPGDPFFAASASGVLILVRFPGEEVPIRFGPTSPPFRVRMIGGDGRAAHQELVSYAIDGVEVPPPMDYLARRAAGGDVYSRKDGSLMVGGLPSTGAITLWPSRNRTFAVTRPLPVTEELELRVP